MLLYIFCDVKLSLSVTNAVMNSHAGLMPVQAKNSRLQDLDVSCSWRASWKSF